MSLFSRADCSAETTAVLPALVTEHPVIMKYAISDSNKCCELDKSRIHLASSIWEPLNVGKLLTSLSALSAGALVPRGKTSPSRSRFRVQTFSVFSLVWPLWCINASSRPSQPPCRISGLSRIFSLSMSSRHLSGALRCTHDSAGPPRVFFSIDAVNIHFFQAR